jgi:hypothetical protein
MGVMSLLTFVALVGFDLFGHLFSGLIEIKHAIF